MKRVLALLLCVAMVLSISACKKKKEEKKETPTTAATTTTTEAYDKLYSYNEIINRFFEEYLVANNDIDVTTIRRDPNQNDHTIYLVVIDECDVTITDVSKKTFSSGMQYALQIQIEGGTTEKSRDRMLSAFASIAMTVDTSYTKTHAENTVETLKNTKEHTGMQRISAYVHVDYTPASDYDPNYRMVLMINDPRIAE